MGMCTFKKKMLAVGSVTCVKHQLEVSHRFTNTTPHPLQTLLVGINWVGWSALLLGQQRKIKTATCKHSKHLAHTTNPFKKIS